MIIGDQRGDEPPIAGRIVSVNRGAVQAFAMPRGASRSAIRKHATDDAVFVSRFGLDGDEQAERRFHGGAVKAVHVYAVEDLAWWSAEIEHPLHPGFIGDNVTTAGIDLNALSSGDELHAGEIILQVTQPRDPCAKLAARIGVPRFVRRFGQAGRTGFYCAVVREGRIRRGDKITVALAPHRGPSIREIVLAKYG